MEWFPYSKNKRYLSGIDWVINALDYKSRQEAGLGNFSQLVLELEPKLDGKLFCEKIGIFLNHYPVMTGRVSRDFNFCPYWRVEPGKRVKFSFAQRALNPKEEALPLIFAFANVGLKAGEYLRFFLVTGANTSFLAVKFDHRLFDAAGIEAFLSLFEEYCLTQKATPIMPTLKPGLCAWSKKFIAGKMVNRFFLKLRKDLKPITFAGEAAQAFNFLPLFFDRVQSAAIYARSLSEAGYLMFMPFALAKSLQSMDKAVKRDGDYLVPVNVNLRPQSSGESIFFNHLSFLFFRVSRSMVNTGTQLCRELALQFFEQTKAKVSDNLAQAAGLMRIAPLPLVAALLDKFMGGKSAAFAFSYLSESAFHKKSFCGCSIKNIFHLPLIPLKPGIGIFFTRYNDCLNLTLVYAKGALSEAQAEALAQELKNNL